MDQTNKGLPQKPPFERKLLDGRSCRDTKIALPRRMESCFKIHKPTMHEPLHNKNTPTLRMNGLLLATNVSGWEVFRGSVLLFDCRSHGVSDFSRVVVSGHSVRTNNVRPIMKSEQR
jgi:hypothetical protein